MDHLVGVGGPPDIWLLRAPPACMHRVVVDVRRTPPTLWPEGRPGATTERGVMSNEHEYIYQQLYAHTFYKEVYMCVQFFWALDYVSILF
jgi:hypothetical protein